MIRNTIAKDEKRHLLYYETLSLWYKIYDESEMTWYPKIDMQKEIFKFLFWEIVDGENSSFCSHVNYVYVATLIKSRKYIKRFL